MKNTISKFYLVVAFLGTTAMMFAQPGANSEDGSLEGNDNEAPIGDYLWALAIVGLVLVFLKFRNNQKSSIQGKAQLL
jgi:hypothetical protein